jgi:hypothetical protein
MNEDFARPLGPAIPKPPPAAPKSVEIKPGIWQAPDGKLETRDPTPPPVLKIEPLPPTSDEMLKAVADAYRQMQDVCGLSGAALVGYRPTWIGVDLAAPKAPLPVPPSTPGFKIGDRVKYNAENIAAMGGCERIIKRIQGDELYFAHPYGWDYADRMIPA